MSLLHVVLPHDIDDERRPSGGDRYDRRVIDGLRADGWTVREHVVPGPWPSPDPTALARLAAAVDALAEGSLVVVDGLVASAAADVLPRAAARLRIVVLVHLPLGGAGERAVLPAAAGVVTTSAWTRQRLLDTLDPARVRVATPGVDPAPLGAGSGRGEGPGGRLLVVGAITPVKGHDVLVEALARLALPGWRCLLAGSPEVDPAYAARLAERLATAGLADRVTLAGALPPDALAAAYAEADLLVNPSRVESFGLVVTEALARGVPVLATDVGGTAEALGEVDGRPPGLLVPPEDPAALTAALRRWLADGRVRAELRRRARSRRDLLPGWRSTADALGDALRTAQRAEVAA